jgi:hypothetical protein
MSLSHDEVLLEEYKQIMSAYEHLDRVAWTMLGIFVPVAGGMFVYVAQHLEEYSLVATVSSGVLSVGVMMLAASMKTRLTDLIHIRDRRMIEIENELGMGQYKKLDELSRKKARKVHRAWLRIQVALKLFIVMLALAWIALIVARASGYGL